MATRKILSKIFQVCLVIFSVAGGIYWTNATIRILLLPDHMYGDDFNSFYICSLFLRKGRNPYILPLLQQAKILNYKIDTDPQQFQHSTPFTLLFFIPLTYLKYETAYWIWTYLNIIFLLLSIYFLFKLQGVNLVDLYKRPIFTVVCLGLIAMFPPLSAHFRTAQLQILLLLLLTVGFYFYQIEKPFLCGLFISFAGVIKLFPYSVVMFFLVKKKYSVLRSILFWTVLFFLLTFLLILEVICSYFTKYIFRIGEKWVVSMVHQISILGMLYKALEMILHTVPENLLKLSRIVAHLINLLLFGLVLKCSLDNKDIDDRLKYSLWILLGVLISLHIWIHYLVLLLPTYFFIFLDIYLKQKGFPKAVVLTACLSYFIIAIYTYLFFGIITPWYEGGNVFPLFFHLYIYRNFYGLLLIFASNLIAVRAVPLRVKNA